jgi:peptidyl-prolyl cis-trans isomerase A (cyclophilin A)
MSRLLLLAIVALAGCPKAAAPTASAATAPAPVVASLTDPSTPDPQAPERFIVRFVTTQGDVVVDIYREWAPRGVDRLHRLVSSGYYTDAAMYRVIDGFAAQFGIHADPAVNALWDDAKIPDDPVVGSNVRGTLTFANAGPGTRTTQLFFNLGDNVFLDEKAFAPLGRVRDLDAVYKAYGGYGEGAPMGGGPDQRKGADQGAAYFRSGFPKLDWILSASVELFE